MPLQQRQIFLLEGLGPVVFALLADIGERY